MAFSLVRTITGGMSVLALSTACAAELNKAHTISVVWSFTGKEGSGPSSRLTPGGDGCLYGETGGGGGGYGVVYKFCPQDQSLSDLYEFKFEDPLGFGPNGGLTLASDGNFYGVTIGGGQYLCYDNGLNGCGVVFKITPSGIISLLHQFVNTDGYEPSSPPVEGPDGYFYGTTYRGGVYGYGTVYRMDSVGNLITLHSFGATSGDGLNPRAQLTLRDSLNNVPA